MSNVLLITASPRGHRSASRTLADDFAKKLTGDTLVFRDVGRTPPPFVSEDWIAGAFNPPETHEAAWAKAIATSDALVDELLAADKIVIATPMFNLGIPAALKAWIDQIIRGGRTFAVTADGTAGLLTGKKALVIVTGGSALAGTPYDFVEPYLRATLGFIGITDVTFVRAEGFGNAQANKSALIAEATAKLDTLAATW